MKVLQVSTTGLGDPRYYRSNELGLCKSLVRLGHEVTLFSSDKHPKWQMLQQRRADRMVEVIDGVKIRRFPSGPELGMVPLMPTLPVEIIRFNLDIIHAHDIIALSSSYSAFASRVRRKPFVLTQHDCGFEATHGAKLFAYMMNNSTVGRFTLQTASAVIGLSSDAIRFVEGFGASAGKARIIPTSVDTTIFRPNQRKIIKEKMGIDSPIVLFVGRLTKIKGVDILLRAFHDALSSAPDANLVIVGRGPEESQLRELQRKLKLDRVFFLGGVPRDEMPLIYSSCDLLALPSLYEPFGNVVIEAMASGLPVLGSKVGGMADVISNGETGYHLRPGDVKHLSNYLKVLLLDNELRLKMSKAARRMAEEKFDDMVVARAVEQIYGECLSH